MGFQSDRIIINYNRTFQVFFLFFKSSSNDERLLWIDRYFGRQNTQGLSYRKSFRAFEIMFFIRYFIRPI